MESYRGFGSYNDGSGFHIALGQISEISPLQEIISACVLCHKIIIFL